MKTYTIVILILISLTQNVEAQTGLDICTSNLVGKWCTGKIKSLEILQTGGRILITQSLLLPGEFKANTCFGNYFTLSNGHDMYHEIYSLLLSAKLSDKKVTISMDFIRPDPQCHVLSVRLAD